MACFCYVITDSSAHRYQNTHTRVHAHSLRPHTIRDELSQEESKLRNLKLKISNKNDRFQRLQQELWRLEQARKVCEQIQRLNGKLGGP